MGAGCSYYWHHIPEAKLIVYYLNGLMRAFEIGSLDCPLCGDAHQIKNQTCLIMPLPGSTLHFADERHWLNRAWTVQGASIGGMIPSFDVKGESLHIYLPDDQS